MKFSFHFISIHDWDIPNVRQKLRMDGICLNFPFILFSSMTTHRWYLFEFSILFIFVHAWNIPNVKQKLLVDGICLNFPSILFPSMTGTFLMTDTRLYLG